ncbi:ABC-2 transporter permease [Clostridium fungisolvens]|uniref:ABC-2 transporter permease n=1 Tax=Clostridium fungisolvens TaxID=1604897 RepID=A0A6V8SN82_9CLOT|nr:ABC-2 transporter permease [Clostridium fungisolvens]GFP76638.1 hypothetical protein bsdtw1_02741 [Clostridium fungisolvens]
MNRIINALKLDFFAGKSTLQLTAILLIPATLIGMISKGPIYTMIFTMVFAVTSSGTIFSIHEKNHSDKLYGILPLKKSEMIIARYLFALIIGTVYAVISGILGLVMSQVMDTRLDSFTFWSTLMLAFIYFCFAASISYPIYLKFSFAKAYIFTMLPMYVIAVVILFMTKKTNFISDLDKVIRFFTDNPALIPIFGILIGLLLLTISGVIANLIYTRKEL